MKGCSTIRASSMSRRWTGRDYRPLGKKPSRDRVDHAEVSGTRSNGRRLKRLVAPVRHSEDDLAT
jgi:hypothetical protein